MNQGIRTMLMGLSVPLIVAGCNISTEEEVRMGCRWMALWHTSVSAILP